jgi:ribulose-phosphate 3-epimerase
MWVEGFSPLQQRFWYALGMALVAPSLFAADFSRLREALELMRSAEATLVHVEVADGHFRSPLTAGQPVVRRLRQATELELDVHLAIERPERYVAEFVAAGADRVAVHVEATQDLGRVLGIIRASGGKAGAALNPATPFEALTEVLEAADFVTVLTAEPEGEFIPRALEKVRQAVRARQERGLGFAIEVEGGLKLSLAEQVVHAGADILVAGSDIFENEDPGARLAEWIRVTSAARQVSRP